ncbi:Alpha/Beta hydrolase protein [Amylostereum chailletii]|nr:Alpha/Beta hydrolase protein [Amylostereum chailletii]
MASLHPLHSSIASRIDPEYAAFHNEHLTSFVHCHEVPWDPSIRNGPTVPGGSTPLPVGSIKDYSTSDDRAPWLRVFTPEGEAPATGWPVFIFFHGGGWTLGGMNSENAFSTNMCKYAKCVVVSVDYRLAPEHPYPAAVEDAVASLQWVWTQGKSLLGIDLGRIAVGGSSSGGNLAAILAFKAAITTPTIPIVFQMLIVPVADNTASVSGKPYASWAENEHTTWLSAERMMWFRHKYLPDEEDWAKWDSSPLLAPDDVRDEGIAFGDKLKTAGVDVEVKLYKGSPHPIMAMDGEVLKSGKDLVSDAWAALARALGTD